MRIARGPRPLPINLFAIAFITQAALAFGHQLSRLEEMQAIFAETMPSVGFDRDLTIVAICARLTIALIPVALLWLLASKVARWLVLALTLGKLAGIPADLARLAPGESVSPFWAAPLVLSAVGAALLFTPSAARWLRSGGRRAADAFR